ncbi:YIP1 family protein [Salidesulfovibrio onnuriiensis]|uniref:YIP1 family protein n=1 Tax=Salidesulfovibrio onnuriiensis TaxID=2583823 RepID=UPI00202B9952|nr:YIP1 family protein [Salidesulfovibrio onnuriiensis]
MLITCPECKFSREINETKIPEKSVIATCPKCKAKFKFRELPGEEDTFSLETAPEKETLPEPPASAEPETDRFPSLHDPAEDPGDELWNKIGGMSPPEGDKHSPAPEREQEAAPFAALETEEPERPVVEVPFERLDQYGFFPGIFATIKRVLFAPHLFFSVMPLGRGLIRPLIFALLILVLHDVLQAVFTQAGLLSPAGLGGEVLTQEEFATFNPFMIIPISPLIWTLGLFLSAGLHHLLLMALKASGGKFEATFRAAAYATAPIILMYIPLPFEMAANVQAGIVFIWNMTITVIGWKCLHRTSLLRAGLAAAIPLLVVGAAYLSSMYGSAPMV